MRAAEEWACRQGAEVMILDCHVANVAAIALYERLGYRTAGFLMRESAGER